VAVTITSPVLGLAVGDPYTGNLESWLLAEGYARNSGTVDGAPGAARAYADGFAVTPAPAAAAVEGSADAVNIVTGGDLVVEIDGHHRYTVALLSGDVPATVVTKVNTAIGSVATASLNAGNFRLASDSTGELSTVRIVSGTGTVLANLFLTAGQFDRGENGNDNAVDYTGDITADGHLTLDAGGKADGVLQVSDPTVAANREDPEWPAESSAYTIANDADHLNDESNPNSPTYTIDGNADGDTTD